MDKDGYIDRLDCEATLKSMGLDSSPEKAEQLMDVCLANRDTNRNKVGPGVRGGEWAELGSAGVIVPCTDNGAGLQS